MPFAINIICITSILILLLSPFMTKTVLTMNVIGDYIYLCADQCYANTLVGFVRESLKSWVYKAIKYFGILH